MTTVMLTDGTRGSEHKTFSAEEANMNVSPSNTQARSKLTCCGRAGTQSRLRAAAAQLWSFALAKQAAGPWTVLLRHW